MHFKIFAHASENSHEIFASKCVRFLVPPPPILFHLDFDQENRKKTSKTSVTNIHDRISYFICTDGNLRWYNREERYRDASEFKTLEFTWFTNIIYISLTIYSAYTNFRLFLIRRLFHPSAKWSQFLWSPSREEIGGKEGERRKRTWQCNLIMF